MEPPDDNPPIIRSLTDIFSNLINNLDNSFIDELRNTVVAFR